MSRRRRAWLAASSRPRESQVRAVLAEVGPRRSCIGCRRVRSEKELLRLALTASGEIVSSRAAPGRGAWLCRDQAVVCGELAQKKRRFGPAFRRSVTDGAANRLLEALRAAGEGPLTG